MSSADIHDLFEPDEPVIRAHLERLFRRVCVEYPDGLAEIAWTDHEGKINHGQLFPITPNGLDKAAEFAAGINRQRRNIYVGVNPRKSTTPRSRRTKAEDVEYALFNFADVDKPPGPEKLRGAALPYSFAVTTGKIPYPRVHPYWERLEATRDMDEWSRLQGALRDTFNGDSISNPDRVMRLAGSVSYPLTDRKLRAGHQVEITSLRTLYDGAERVPVAVETLRQVYPPQSLQSAWEAAETPAGAGPTKLDWGIDRVDPEVYVRNIKAGHELHNNALRLAAHLVMTGHRDWLIRDYLAKLLEPVSDGGTLGLVDQFIGSERRKTNTPDPDEDFNAPPPGRAGLPIEWIGDVQPSLDASDFVEGLLCSAGMSVIYGESNCGKTFFVTDLAYHIATGRAWRGREIEQGGVIYVALEGGFGIRNRLFALKQHFPTEGLIPLAVVACSINLLDANADTGPLIDLIKEAAEKINMPIRLVVIDTLARAMNGGNENAPEDMGKLVKSADRIREQTGAHVAFVHHSGKDQARGARGHSSLRAATDTEIEIVREEGTDISIATVNKQRELEIEGQFAFALKQVSLGVNKRGKDVTSCIVSVADAPEGSSKKVKLTDVEFSFWREIKEMYARDGLTELTAPEHGMPTMRVLRRDQFRGWLVKRGKLAVTERVTGDRNVGNAERQRLHRVLNSLDSKGFIGMNEAFLWALK